MSDREQAKRLSAVVMESLDQAGSAEQLARQAFHSRSQFFRLFRALLDETPAALRRRLLLERAAWHLAHSRQAVTFIALDAGYGSLEAFTRAFKTAFYVSPSVYRRMGTTYTRLPASNQSIFASPRKELHPPWTYTIFLLVPKPGTPAACWTMPAA